MKGSARPHLKNLKAQLDANADRKLVKSGSYMYTVSLNTPKIWNQLMLKKGLKLGFKVC